MSFPRLAAVMHVAIVVMCVVLPSFMQAWLLSLLGFCYRLKPSTVAIAVGIYVTVAVAAAAVDALSYNSHNDAKSSMVWSLIVSFES